MAPVTKSMAWSWSERSCSRPRARFALAALACTTLACSGEMDGPSTGGPGTPVAGATGANGEPLPPGAAPQALPDAQTPVGAPATPGAGVAVPVPVTGPDGSAIVPTEPARTVAMPTPAGTADPTLPAGSATPTEAAVTPPAPASPGSVVVRRLNHAEYDHTVQDLLGTTLTPATNFLTDDPGAGFDTVGAAASLSPTYVRDYEEAAHALIADLYADAERLAAVVPCNVETQGLACAQSAMEAFARRAFRRPVTPAEVTTLLTPFTTAQTLGASPTEGMRHSLAAVLLSPHFIFKLELDPDPTSTLPRRLTDHELATRLSYALWSTMPDEALFAAADSGSLGTDAGLAAELDRMLADPKIEALADTFAAQWLDFRHLAGHQVDPELFGQFDAALARSMQEEAKRFFLAFLTGDHTLDQLLTARFTFVDERLAGHYGLPLPGGSAEEMSLVDTSTAARTGLLTLGAILTSTSYTTRTSPVRRGQFVMDRLLCSEVPPPPPEIEGLPEEEVDANAAQTMTLRQRFEQHRQDPACFTCHQLMDPIGFGLENYDAIGRYRTDEGGLPIDASGELAGVAFSGAIDLAGILSADPAFERCLTEKLMTFGLGRYVDQPDDPTWIAHLSGTVRDAGGNLSDLVRALVMSEAFRSRQPSL